MLQDNECSSHLHADSFANIFCYANSASYSLYFNAHEYLGNRMLKYNIHSYIWFVGYFVTHFFNENLT